jgi:hypothetical protein
MRILKYIINEKELPVIFDTKIMHCDIVTNAVSAGFFVIYYSDSTDRFEVKCFGESESLKIGFRTQDQSIIENFLNKKLIENDNALTKT